MIKTSQQINQERRRFLGAAAAAIVSANFSFGDSATAESNEIAEAAAVKSSNTPFGPLKQITAGLLNVG
ncbi:MAG TPA: hypothetical protein VFE38_07525 [Edaphobacter sp.]|nr:hypothetical protein [Edaphobacter sp.]